MILRRRRPRPYEPVVVPLPAAELEALTSQLADARAVVARYADAGADLPSAEDLDAALTAWSADGPDRPDADHVAAAVGAAFGEHLRRAAGLAWVLATDEWGTDVALHGSPGDLLLHPHSSVASRIAEGEIAFVAVLLRELVTAVEDRRREG